MNIRNMYNEQNKRIVIKAEEQRSAKNGRFEDLPTNYGELHPIVKISILDTIINSATAVFGPYGGIYGELKAANMTGGQEITEGGYEKSKDGHSFFNGLELGSKYAQTIMKSIQQMTKYVAGYEGDTSRDGTTSVAIVGCQAAKQLLINTMDKVQVPSTIQNMIFDIALNEGTKLIEEYKVPVYDKNTLKYLDRGFNRAINAIRTTVDGNMLFIKPFEDLMREAEEKGYDLLNCYLASPNNVDGIAKLELNVNAGIRFRATDLDPKTAGGFYNHQSYTFVLDGYISPEHRDVYVYHLKNWLKHICSLKDQQGLLFEAGRYNVPLIIVTRTPDYLESVYKHISEEGVEVTCNGRKHVIKPKFMIGNNTESFKVYFDDMLDVFSETRIDLNKMNRYIRATKKTSDAIDETLGMAKPVKQDEVNLTSLFPRISADANGTRFTISVPYSDDEYDEGIPDGVEQKAKFDKLNTYEFTPANIMLISNYDGQSLSLVPPNDVLGERANAKRESLLKMKSSMSDLAITDNSLDERLAFFSSMTIKPIIHARSKDEYYQMFSIYEDALGVFQSIHKHGVMPGGNTFMIKFGRLFKENTMNRLRDLIINHSVVAKDKSDRYMEFATDVVESLLQAYSFTYYLLVGDAEIDKVETELINRAEDEKSSDILTTYNIVTGYWDDSVVEASRTTADVFASAITMMKDMLQLKRVKLFTENGEHTQVNLANKELTLSKMYEKYSK